MKQTLLPLIFVISCSSFFSPSKPFRPIEDTTRQKSDPILFESKEILTRQDLSFGRKMAHWHYLKRIKHPFTEEFLTLLKESYIKKVPSNFKIQKNNDKNFTLTIQQDQIIRLFCLKYEGMSPRLPYPLEKCLEFSKNKLIEKCFFSKKQNNKTCWNKALKSLL